MEEKLGEALVLPVRGYIAKFEERRYGKGIERTRTRRAKADLL